MCVYACAYAFVLDFVYDHVCMLYDVCVVSV